MTKPVTHDDALRGRLNVRQALEYICNELREQIDGDSPQDGWKSDLIRVAEMALAGKRPTENDTGAYPGSNDPDRCLAE